MPTTKGRGEIVRAVIAMIVVPGARARNAAARHRRAVSGLVLVGLVPGSDRIGRRVTVRVGRVRAVIVGVGRNVLSVGVRRSAGTSRRFREKRHRRS